MVSSSQIPNECLVNWNPLRKSSSRAETMSPISSPGASRSSTKRIRTACDLCRQSRIKCSGGSTCQRCASNGLKCNYGVSLRNGRAKATVRPTSSSSSRTKRPRRDSSKQGEERTMQNAGFDVFTEAMCEVNTENCFSDLAMATNEQFLMGSGNFTRTSPMPKDLSFNYPSPNSNMFPIQSSSETGVISSRTGLGISTPELQLQPSLDFSFSDSQADIGTESTASAGFPPTAFNAGAILGLSSRTNCRCLSTQLFCVAELCNMEDHINIALDAILQIVREKSKSVSEYLSCKQCSKTSVNFIFPAIILQRVVLLLCNVARHGLLYVQSMKLIVGSFELSLEDDVFHKKLLISSAVKQADAVLSELCATAENYQQRNRDSILESGRENLKWIFETVQSKKARLRIITGLLEARDWGCQVSMEDLDCCRPT